MKEDGPGGLGGNHDGDTHQVSGEGRPRHDTDLRDCVAQIGFNHQALIGANKDVVPDECYVNPEPFQNHLNH